MSKFKKLAASVGKVLLFVVLFLCIYNYTNDAFRGSNMHNAIPFLADQPDESYDVVLAGSCHMQLSIQPAQLFSQYGIAACNTGSASQSVPTSYFLIKEMIDRHSPELVVLDIFTLHFTELASTRAWVHEALDGFPLSISKAKAINALVEDNREEFYLPYTFYHRRWKELEKADYHLETSVAEKYQFSVDGIVPFPEPFTLVAPQETAEIPQVPREYLEKIIQLCKESGTKLLLTVSPYRADILENDIERAEYIQRTFNYVEKLASEYGVDYLNSLYYVDEMGLNFSEDMVDSSHVNAIGSEKVSAFYGRYLTENYDLPDRSDDRDFEDWHEDCREYWSVLEQRQALCRQPKQEAPAEVQE